MYANLLYVFCLISHPHILYTNDYPAAPLPASCHQTQHLHGITEQLRYLPD
ncbi:hypothetical protein CLOSTASPAR_00114 [[Clostridium] asparagiforme DSM 15981]|uniref:Uncharacterized protein n=1 Tax=[Clostridium] asparagiforme DSM 15981 TaxID=518636 RepID=C0CT18_9FIRM|nr:hypothetical protein CLOSTASPAR_00114 [[Clostridium] asparagiforme DSM 15981]